jgi:UDP-glucose 4-epimerase
MVILITGLAGFIGTNLTRNFLAQDHTVIGIDNFCNSSKNNIAEFYKNELFHFIELDLFNYEELVKCLSQVHQKHSIEQVWHLAANSDIPAGVANIDVDYRNTFMTTMNILKSMKLLKISSLVFASTSAIYGDLGDKRIVEDAGPLLPISNYGAMKLASEALISSSFESYLKSAYIFRFPNVIGVPATHGVILDFIKKLKLDPTILNVLGNGTQQKAYLHVNELIDAMCFIVNNAKDKLNYFNIGNVDNGVTVKFIAESVVETCSPKAKINYGKENRGWVGDVPKFNYSIEKLLNLGWSPKLSSSESILKAIQEITIQTK